MVINRNRSYDNISKEINDTIKFKQRSNSKQKYDHIESKINLYDKKTKLSIETHKKNININNISKNIKDSNSKDYNKFINKNN